MKKIFLIVAVFCFSIVNVKALSIKVTNSNYYIKINDNVYNFKKLKNIDNNSVLFNWKYDNYTNLANYQEIKNDISIDHLNEINNAIKFGYQEHGKSDIFYYLTQTLIYKYYYGFDNAYMCSSDGTKLTVYDDLINNIINDSKLTELSDKRVQVFEELTLDSNFEYDLDDFDNLVVGEYEIEYNTKETNSTIYYNTNNYLFAENNTGIRKGIFKIYVDGIKFDLIGDNTSYQLFENDRLLKEFTSENVPKYLKKNTEYYLLYDDKKIKLKTTEENFKLNLVELEEKNEETEEERETNESLMASQEVNPKTNDNLVIIALIFIFSWIFYLILYKKYRKSLIN